MTSPQETMAFPIPNAVLEPYIRQAVSTAIAASLGDGVKLVEQAVQSALATKVAANGRISNSSYENNHLLPDIVAKNAIQAIARETITELAEQMRPKIKEQIEKQLKTKHNALATALVDGLIGSLKTSWNVQVTVEAK